MTEEPTPTTPTESPESTPEAPPELSQDELDAALWDAATEGAGNPEQITALIEQGANPNMTREFIGEQIPLLQQAARTASAETIQALEANGADWGALTQEQKNWALLNSTCTGNSYTVSALVKAGADPGWANEFGETPAMVFADPTFYEGAGCNPQDPEEIKRVLQEAGLDLSLEPAPEDPAMALADAELGG